MLNNFAQNLHWLSISLKVKAFHFLDPFCLNILILFPTLFLSHHLLHTVIPIQLRKHIYKCGTFTSTTWSSKKEILHPKASVQVVLLYLNSSSGIK